MRNFARAGSLLLAVLVSGCGGDGDGAFSSLFHPSGPHVSAEEQRSLPVQAYALGEGLCPGNYVERPLARKWRRAALAEYEALKRALLEHPDNVVTARFTLSDPEPGQSRIDRRELTVRQLAETHLEPLDVLPEDEEIQVSGTGSARCQQELEDELTSLIEESR